MSKPWHEEAERWLVNDNYDEFDQARNLIRAALSEREEETQMRDLNGRLNRLAEFVTEGRITVRYALERAKVLTLEAEYDEIDATLLDVATAARERERARIEGIVRGSCIADSTEMDQVIDAINAPLPPFDLNDLAEDPSSTDGSPTLSDLALQNNVDEFD